MALEFSYTGALIDTVTLKKDTTTLNSVSFTYTYATSELVEVEDHAGKTVAYVYGTEENKGDEYGRFITKITDKAGRESDLDWTWKTTGTGEARKIEITNADGLKTIYDRSTTSNVATVSNMDGTTLLTKIVNTPLSSADLARSKYHDYYTDATNFERWEYQYNTGNMLTKIVAPDTSDYWTLTRDAKGRPLTRAHGSGPAEEWAYDGDGRVTTYTDTAGIETAYTYNVDGLVEKVTHPSVHADGYRFEYDAYGHLTLETSPLGTETAYTYDIYGRVTE